MTTICVFALGAQPSQTLYTVKVAPDHADWSYRTGEEARFTLSVTRDKVPLKNATLSYEYGPEPFLLRMRNVSNKSCRENQHIFCVQ